MKGLTVVKPTINNMVAAKIDFNKEEVKQFLEDALFLYGNQVVTEDTVKDAKKTCAELNKLSKNIDSFRKETEKQLVQEVNAFKSDIKEIKAIIEDTYQPIKEQVDFFTEKQRQEKQEIVEGIIDAVRHELDLRDEFYKSFEFDSSWLNASMSANKVRESVQVVMSHLKSLQDMHDMKIDAISSILSVYNEKLRFKYNVLDFEQYINDNDISNLTKLVKEKVEQRLFDEQEELARIEKEKQEAIERAKREAEAEAQRRIEEEEARHQEELRRKEFEKFKELEQEKTAHAVVMQETFEKFNERGRRAAVLQSGSSGPPVDRHRHTQEPGRGDRALGRGNSRASHSPHPHRFARTPRKGARRSVR